MIGNEPDVFPDFPIRTVGISWLQFKKRERKRREEASFYRSITVKKTNKNVIINFICIS